ncbi:MAG: tRNA pseudouridine(38-40) synthase TruA [Candidatus Thermoplasmatota archaeon]|nr:tRNA pseudouridine(38-40) synthase TruA [Candidatus Thermoplasmatota archaeon]
MRLALKLAYDGKKFLGYARQKELRTVEGAIIKALRELDIINLKSCKFQSSSRTDRNVSALGNVIAFNTNFDYRDIIKALNVNLKDIWFYAKKIVAPDFNPRHAVQRWYRYFLMKDKLKISNIRKSAKLFIGKHDFSSFAKPSERCSVRKIDYIGITSKEPFLIIDIKAPNFLWHQVRKIVTALQKVGLEELSAKDLKEALSGSKKLELAPAPPESLILMDVRYNFKFEVDCKALELLRKFLNWKFESLEAERSIVESLLKTLNTI